MLFLMCINLNIKYGNDKENICSIHCLSHSKLYYMASIRLVYLLFFAWREPSDMRDPETLQPLHFFLFDSPTVPFEPKFSFAISFPVSDLGSWKVKVIKINAVIKSIGISLSIDLILYTTKGG